MGNLINLGFIAFWADTRKGRNAHGGCNSRVNVYYGCLAYLGGPICVPVQFGQVVLKDEGVGGWSWVVGW